MKAKADRRSDAKASPLAFALFLFAAALGPRATLAADAPIGIVLDQASIMKLPEKVATIVIGNPLIADVAVQSGGLVVLTGKGYGSTNFIALDRAGAVLMERAIVVRGSGDRSVQVYRGTERETYSCTPQCERRVTLGDSPAYFTSVLGQSDSRNGQASTAGKPAAR